MITDEKELYKNFTDRDDDFIHVSKSLGFIDACIKNKVGILGIDSFNVNDEIRPIMEHIADFSKIKYSNWDEFVFNSTSLAKKFLKTVPYSLDLYFDIVIEVKKEEETSP